MSVRSVRRDEAAEGITPADIVPADALSLVAQRTGYLTKRSDHGLIRSWRKRFCVLNNSHLLYYDAETSSTPRGIIYLEDAAVSMGPVRQFSGARRRVFYFKDATEYILRSWFESLSAVQGVIIADASSAPSTPTAAAPAPVSTIAAPATMVEMPVEEAEEAQTDDEDADVLVIPPAPGMSLREPSTGLVASRASSSSRAVSSSGAAAMPSDGIDGVDAAAFGITAAVVAEIGTMSAEAQIAWMSLLPLMQTTHEQGLENAALRAQLPALLEARSDAMAVAERDQATIALLSRQLGSTGSMAPADVLTAVAEERRAWEGRMAAAESSWSERLRLVEADVDARVAQELRESMVDLRNAERAGRRAVEARATEEATSLATKEMSAAIHQVQTAKNVEIDALRLALGELCVAAGEAGVAIAPHVADLARARAPSGVAVGSDDAESTSSAVGADEEPRSVAVNGVSAAQEAEMAAVQARLEAAEAQAAVASAALRETQAQLLQLQQRVASAAAAAAGGDDAAAAAQTVLELKVDELSRMLRVSAEEKERLVADGARLRAQVTALELQTTGLTTDLTEARASNDALRDAMLTNDAATKVDAVSASLRMENNGLRGELDEIMASSALHKSERAAWREHVQALEVRCATMQARTDAMQAQLGMRPLSTAPTTPRTPGRVAPMI